jgi:pilus assembly protein CpaC
VQRPHRRVRATIAALMLQPAIFAIPAQSFEIVAPVIDRTVSMNVGAGQLIRVDSEFSSLFVANPDVADVEVKSPRLLYLTGVGVGETTLFAVDEEDNVLMSALIRVTHNTNALQEGISRVAPGQRITATTIDQSLVITGEIGTPQQAADIMQVANQFVDDPSQVVNRMNVAAPTQVNLQVRIAEVNRNVDRQLGIRWGAMGLSTNGNAQWGLVGGGNPQGGALQGGYDVSLGYNGPRINVDVMLQALSEEGMVTVLAEPNLTARSGESANFLAGGEYPYQTVSDNGTNTEFKDFGIGLTFTPTVLDGNRISLTVATEVSDLNFSYNTEIPSLVSRRAETTVDLASGQSFAIAGLMQSSSAQNAAKMPGVNNIPVLGALFRSSGFKRGQTELVIIVTPIIVEPTTARRARTPVDGYVPPNDFERILLGRFQGDTRQVSQVRNRISQRRLYGNSGFVFE